VAYDEELDQRIADVVSPWGAVRKQMFGGTCYLLKGNMMAGVHAARLILRLGTEDGSAALDEPFVGPFDLTRKPMAGWVQVDPPGFEGERLREWLVRARKFAASLPPK
jgi:TfoX/Sxy family transcriptional regulator of competence genes